LSRASHREIKAARSRPQGRKIKTRPLEKRTDPSVDFTAGKKALKTGSWQHGKSAHDQDKISEQESDDKTALGSSAVPKTKPKIHVN
jgi:hypothetical protein